jgi:transposase-like protein
MTGKIPVCPDCDSSRFFPRSGRHNGEPGWKCVNCDELKDSVTYRDRKTPHNAASGTLARKLLDMDPEEV